MVIEPGQTTGILGKPWRATVTASGDLIPWNGSEPLTWSIAAEDRWHFPDGEASTRQTSVAGTPVFETRVRIPNGDVVQHVWSASVDAGLSATLVEFTNESPMPIAIALSRADISTPRSFHVLPDALRPWPSADRGIERPPLVIPLGHRARMRVAVAHAGSIPPDRIDAFAPWDTVARGWVSVTDAASTIHVPDRADGVPLEELIRAWRSEIALGDSGWVPDTVEESIPWIIAHRELLRMGLTECDPAGVVTVLEPMVRHVRRNRSVEPNIADALASGAYLLGRCDDRALADFGRALGRAVRRISGAPRADDAARILDWCPRRMRSGIGDWTVPDLDVVGVIEGEFARWSAAGEVTLFPEGIHPSRVGVDVEVHGVLAGPAHRISLAVRWHGQHPAVLWELEGPPGLMLRSGVNRQWTSSQSSGETLWPLAADSSPSP